METTRKLNMEGNTATTYDNVYRTLLNDCTSLIIPVVNISEVYELYHDRLFEQYQIGICRFPVTVYGQYHHFHL